MCFYFPGGREVFYLYSAIQEPSKYLWQKSNYRWERNQYTRSHYWTFATHFGSISCMDRRKPSLPTKQNVDSLQASGSTNTTGITQVECHLHWRLNAETRLRKSIPNQSSYFYLTPNGQAAGYCCNYGDGKQLSNGALLSCKKSLHMAGNEISPVEEIVMRSSKAPEDKVLVTIRVSLFAGYLQFQFRFPMTLIQWLSCSYSIT